MTIQPTFLPLIQLIRAQNLNALRILINQKPDNLSLEAGLIEAVKIYGMLIKPNLYSLQRTDFTDIKVEQLINTREIIEYFLDELNVSINTTDRYGNSLLHFAACGVHTSLLQYLSDKGAVYTKNSWGALPIHAAAELGLNENIKYLLDIRPEDANAQDHLKHTPLHYARTYHSTLELLICRGASPFLRDIYNQSEYHKNTILFHSMFSERPKLREAMLSNFQILLTTYNFKNFQDIWLPQFEKLREFSFIPQSLAEALVININNQKKQYLEHWLQYCGICAVREEDGKLVIRNPLFGSLSLDLFKEIGSYIKISDLRAPNHKEVSIPSMNHSFIIKDIAIAASQFNLQDSTRKLQTMIQKLSSSYRTVHEDSPSSLLGSLHPVDFHSLWKTEYNKKKEQELFAIVKNLPNENIDGDLLELHSALFSAEGVCSREKIKTLYCDGRNTLLHAAARKGNIKVFDLILPYFKDSNLDPKNLPNETPLGIAVNEGHVEIVKRLIESEASLQYRPAKNFYLRPEDAATLPCSKEHFEVMKLLIINGVELYSGDLVTYIIRNDQQYFTRAQQYELIELFCRYKAQLSNPEIYSDLTPLDTAYRAKDLDLIELLLEYGAKTSLNPEPIPPFIPSQKSIVLSDINTTLIREEPEIDLNNNNHEGLLGVDITILYD